MPVYINGVRDDRGSSQVSQEDVIKRIIDAVTKNGTVGYTGHLSEEDMSYLRIALKDIADKTVKRIFITDMMDGVDISRVVDVYDAYPYDVTEVVDALVD